MTDVLFEIAFMCIRTLYLWLSSDYYSTTKSSIKLSISVLYTADREVFALLTTTRNL